VVFFIFRRLLFVAQVGQQLMIGNQRLRAGRIVLDRFAGVREVLPNGVAQDSVFFGGGR
jgi:hypothetical protein